MLGGSAWQRRVLFTQSVPILAAITSVNEAPEALNDYALCNSPGSLAIFTAIRRVMHESIGDLNLFDGLLLRRCSRVPPIAVLVCATEHKKLAWGTAQLGRPEMEMVGAILFAVLLYAITIELWRLVARRSRRAVLQRAGVAGNGGRPINGSNPLQPHA